MSISSFLKSNLRTCSFPLNRKTPKDLLITREIPVLCYRLSDPIITQQTKDWMMKELQEAIIECNLNDQDAIAKKHHFQSVKDEKGNIQWLTQQEYLDLDSYTGQEEEELF